MRDVNSLLKFCTGGKTRVSSQSAVDIYTICDVARALLLRSVRTYVRPNVVRSSTGGADTAISNVLLQGTVN